MLHHQPNNAKVERLEKCSKFVKGRGNVRIVVFHEPCALIKNIEVLLERAKIKHAMFWFCNNCTYWLTLNIQMMLMNAVYKSNQR